MEMSEAKVRVLASNYHITDKFESYYLARTITMSHKRLCSIFLVLEPGLITTELDFHFICKKLSNMLRVKCAYSAVLCILTLWSKIIRNPNEAKDFKGIYESNVEFPKECVRLAGSDQNTKMGGVQVFSATTYFTTIKCKSSL